MIRVVRYQDNRFTRGGVELIRQPPADGWLWVDLYGTAADDFRTLWEHVGDVPAPARADFEDVGSQPLFDHHDGGASVWSLKALGAIAHSIDFTPIPIGLLVQGRLLLTRHGDESKSIDGVMAELESLKPKTAMEAALAVCQRVFDRYLPIVRGLEARLEEIDDLVFEKPADSYLAELTNYKTRLRRMRRFLTYHTQTFAQMADQLDEELNPGERRGLKGVQDSVDRLNALCGTFYDMCGDLVDGYISLASHRMNQIMKVLTMVTVVFVPLGFMAGIYGMNFETMPELSFKYAYFVLLGTMGVVATSILYIFHRKHWF